MISSLLACAAADVPVLLWGPPGVGKTATIAALARERGVHLEVLIGSTLDPTDLQRPYISQAGEYLMSPAPFAQRLKAALDAGRAAWLFLDELTCAPPSVQAALLRVVCERFVGDVDLRGVRIFAAANPVDQAADGADLSLASLNRWCHLDYTPDVDAWCTGELGGWGSPDPELSGSRGAVVGWIRHSRGALCDPPPQHQEGVRGWPSPRAWSAVARLGVDAPESLVAGLVGAAAAREFFCWKAALDLPDPAAVLAGNARIPERGDQRYAAYTSVISYAAPRPEVHESLWGLLLDARKDMTAVFARMAVRAIKNPEMSPALERLVRVAL